MRTSREKGHAGGSVQVSVTLSVLPSIASAMPVALSSTQRCCPDSSTSTTQLVYQVQHEAGSRHSDGVAERDCAAAVAVADALPELGLGAAAE